jgi:hypothetical protein
VARQMGRRAVLVDSNPEAVAVMRRRLGTDGVRYLDMRTSSTASNVNQRGPCLG